MPLRRTMTGRLPQFAQTGRFASNTSMTVMEILCGVLQLLHAYRQGIAILEGFLHPPRLRTHLRPHFNKSTYAKSGKNVVSHGRLLWRPHVSYLHIVPFTHLQTCNLATWTGLVRLQESGYPNWTATRGRSKARRRWLLWGSYRSRSNLVVLSSPQPCSLHMSYASFVSRSHGTSSK